MEARKAAVQRGVLVFAGLVALTLLEFWLAAVAQGPLPYPVLCGLLAPVTWLAMLAANHALPFLIGIATIKAALIMYFFMHLGQLWRRAGGHG